MALLRRTQSEPRLAGLHDKVFVGVSSPQRDGDVQMAGCETETTEPSQQAEWIHVVHTIRVSVGG